MGAYILRRLLLMIPTLLGILLMNFLIVQSAPGGPIERVVAELSGLGGENLARVTGGGGDVFAEGGDDSGFGARGIDPRFIEQIREDFGLDKPLFEQYWIMIGNFATFDFGDSFFKGRPVVDLIVEKLPVSLTLGFWTLFLSYLISIPLGIAKAVRDGTPFDTWTSAVVIIGYAIPNFLFAIILLVFFSGGSFLQIFPLRGLSSEGASDLPFLSQVADYFWHIALPILSLAISGFATLTLLTKNSFLDEVRKQYVMTARAKGLTERRVLYGHVFRNAMLIVIAGFPAAFITLFTTGSLLIETIFSLDGLGLLGYEAVLDRDYPIIFGTLFLFSLIGLIATLISDLTYTIIDPRIDFESRQT